DSRFKTLQQNRRISTQIECKNGQFKLTVEIPVNTTAEIIFPDNNGSVEVGSGIHSYKFPTTIDLTQEVYSFESTLGEIVANPKGKAMLVTLSPGILDNPMIEYAYEMTINELSGQAAEAKPLFAAIIDSLNKNED
ncbi:alpha-L-rhamnosidase C-terminal domain-containing protein, partial [Enterococcus gilvus]